MHGLIYPIKYSPKDNEDILTIKLKINTKEKNSKMKFFDSFQTPNINLKQLLNLNFNTGKLKYILQPSGPTFKVTVDTNTFFSIKKNFLMNLSYIYKWTKIPFEVSIYLNIFIFKKMKHINLY